uniref:Uncharacterized protein n=1 Tax=viral metagenome TaxID=1070528 RepID=A0A6C0JND9_9ZZZZ
MTVIFLLKKDVKNPVKSNTKNENISLVFKKYIKSNNAKITRK